jgi:hypothetical protein
LYDKLRDDTFELMILISPDVEPSDPSPLPIPEPTLPSASTVEFVMVMEPTVEKPPLEKPAPIPEPPHRDFAVTLEFDRVISPIVVFPPPAT